MRRLVLLLFLVAAVVSGTPIVAGPAYAQTPPEDPRRGVTYDGLRPSARDSFCAGAFEAFIGAEFGSSMKQVLCTHGPDPAPEGVDVREDRGPEPTAEFAFPSASSAEETGAVPCFGTGTDGYRVQLLYARSTSRTDRFPAYAASFKSWAARLDQVVSDSAAETGGTRHVRLVTDAACNPVIERVTLSSGAMSSFSTMVSELHSRGYARTDRKYLVWADTNVYCGISEIYVDDRADPTPGRNYNNGHPWVQGAVARVDNGCWGLSNLVEAHELLHLLGGVQPTAPNATPGFHCTDESDRLCYADGSAGATMRQVCPTWHESLYDCNHDDYFSTAPAPDSYLATHWNSANSAFLSRVAPGGAVSTTTTSLPPTTTTTTATTTTVPPTTTTTPPSTTTTIGPTTTTTTAPTGSVPSAPQALSARQPATGSGVQLSWQPPATGPVTGYRVYRGTTPGSQTLLTALPNVLSYNDASAGPALYYYRLTAFNSAGEGPSSALTGMIGKTASTSGIAGERNDPRLAVSGFRMRAPLSNRWA